MQGFDPSSVIDGRKTCRSARDALCYLGISDAEKNAVATIHSGKILCPNGQILGMVLIGTGRPGDCDRRYLRGPDSNSFQGLLMDGTPIGGDIVELNGSAIELDSTVELSDKRRIRGLKFLPSLQFKHYDFTARQHSIVHQALIQLGENHECYRAVDQLPNVKWLDYTAVRSVRIPHVKRLLALIQGNVNVPTSKVEIELTLRLAGVEFPGPTWRPK